MEVRAWARATVGTAIGLLGAATALAFLDQVAWWFEILTIPRLQYAALLVILTLPAVALRLPRAAAAAVVLATINLVSMWAMADSRAAAAADGVPIRVVVVNIGSGNDRYSDLVRLVGDTNADVVGVVELDPAWANELVRRLPAHRYRSLVPQHGAYGLGVFSRVTLLGRVEHFPAQGGPPTVVAEIRAPRAAPATFVLTHVHTPFAGSIHERQLEELAAARPRLGRRVAVCGDFNTVPWAASFRRLAATGLTDLYDALQLGYTWPTWNPFLRLPIDNCLVDGLTIADHERGPDIGSDHYPLIVDLVVPEAR